MSGHDSKKHWFASLSNPLLTELYACSRPHSAQDHQKTAATVRARRYAQLNSSFGGGYGSYRWASTLDLDRDRSHPADAIAASNTRLGPRFKLYDNGRSDPAHWADFPAGA